MTDDNLPTLETVCAAVENKKLSCHKSCLGPKKAQLTLRTAKESSAKHVHFKDECGGPLVETYYMNDWEYRFHKNACCVVM